MFDVVCLTNPVNAAVYLDGVCQAGHRRRRLVLYDGARLGRRHLPPGAGLFRPQSLWWLRLLKLAAWCGLVDEVLVPHHRLNRRWLGIMRRARSVAYLDDGLDGRRVAPRNFEPGLLAQAGGGSYYTFRQYSEFPAWIGRWLRVVPVADLAALNPPGAAAPAGLADVDAVLFESPGLRLDALLAWLAAAHTRVLVVRHPVPAKRQAIDLPVAEVDGAAICSEALIAAASGKQLYLGETMLLYVALHGGAAARNEVYAQLARAQVDNLVGMRLSPLDAGPGLDDLYRVG
ncbi:MAG: hypothetical protein RLZZ584_1494 [Pseudomonadota bacterium]|jgi:hypothetical protein